MIQGHRGSGAAGPRCHPPAQRRRRRVSEGGRRTAAQGGGPQALPMMEAVAISSSSRASETLPETW